jgi:hypothetical protein
MLRLWTPNSDSIEDGPLGQHVQSLLQRLHKYVAPTLRIEPWRSVAVSFRLVLSDSDVFKFLFPFSPRILSPLMPTPTSVLDAGEDATLHKVYFSIVPILFHWTCQCTSRVESFPGAHPQPFVP